MAGTKQPEQAMTRTRLFFILAATTSLGVLALTAARAHDVPKVATGFVANILCSETFVSGLDPERVFAETTEAMPGADLITWAMNYKVDRTARDVTVTLFGAGRSRAVYREGLGCYLAVGGAVADSAPPPEHECQPALLPDIAGPSVVAPGHRSSARRWIARSPSLTRHRSAAPGRWSWSRTAASSPSAMRMVTASTRRSSASPRPNP
jgi:hypothetical protein